MNPVLQMVYLVRHADTAWTLTGQHSGRTDLPLTEQGERQARELEATLTLQSACASCAVGKGGFLPAPNAFTALLAYRMQYAEEVGTLSSARIKSGLLGRGPLDWEGSVR